MVIHYVSKRNKLTGVCTQFLRVSCEANRKKSILLLISCQLEEMMIKE